MALAWMSHLEQKIGSLLNIFPAFKNEERILPVSVHPTKLDGHWLSPTTAGQCAEISNTLPKSPFADTVWGSVPFSSFQILAHTILWCLPHFQYRAHALSAVPCFFQRAAQGYSFRGVDQQLVGIKSMDKH